MEKDKAKKSTKSSKDPKSSKSTKESKEAKEKLESKDTKESSKERDAQDSKRSKDAKEKKSEHRRDRETRSERERRSEHEKRSERAGRSEHDGRSERKSKGEREERRERERTAYSKHDERSTHGRRNEYDERSEHQKKGHRESRRDRETKHERSALESKREPERQREGKHEHLDHTKSSRDVKDEKSERKIKDKKVSRDVKEVKGDKEDKEYTKTAMQDIKELIMRALECELDGHILEARMLYEESLAKLERCSSEEKNEEISESYSKYLNSYEKHVQHLREHIEQSMFGCKIIEHIAIPKGVRGRSFQKLFGCYLDDKVSLVHIYEPYLTQSSQLEHLINFVEVLVKNCPNLMFVRVITRASPRSDKLQSEVLHDLREELEGGNISFNYQFDEELKIPRIILNTGVVIRCRRGLHIYKPVSKYYKLGLYDYDFRRCESCEFDVYQGKSFSESISKADRTDLMESLLHA